MTPDSDELDFFISYNGADKEWASWIAWQLEKAGYSVVVQAWDFRPGSNFVIEMDAAAARARRTLVVLSPNFVTSQFTRPEWAAAFAKDPTGAQRKIVPVLVAPTDTSGLLEQIVYIDLVGLSREDAAAVLIAGLEPGRSKPAAEPDFPGGVATPCAAAPIRGPRDLDWRPITTSLTSVSRADALPAGLPRSGPATLELTLVPVEQQALRVGQLQALADELATVGRETGLFTQAAALEAAHTADVAYARTDRRERGDEAGMLVTRTGQRSAWITLPNDMMGSVVDRQQMTPRLSSLLKMLATLSSTLPERVAFTARIAPLMSVMVGDSRVVGNRNSATMRGFGGDPFPLEMPDTVRGDAIAGRADELADEAMSRILAALAR